MAGLGSVVLGDAYGTGLRQRAISVFRQSPCVQHVVCRGHDELSSINQVSDWTIIHKPAGS
jgi:hypothetical protein